MGSNRSQFKQVQGPSSRDQGPQDYMAWENLIEDTCGVKCTVRVELNGMSIRTESYSDYVLAKSVVSKRTGMEIVRG